MSDLYADMGMKLRLQREQLGFTQQTVAAAMRVKGFDKWISATVSSVECARRDCGLQEIAALCAILDVTLAELLEGCEWAVPLFINTGPQQLTELEDEERRKERIRRLYVNVFVEFSKERNVPEVLKRERVDAITQRYYGMDFVDAWDHEVLRYLNYKGTQTQKGHVTRRLISDMRKRMQRDGIQM